jgi:hypothetical protein
MSELRIAGTSTGSRAVRKGASRFLVAAAAIAAAAGSAQAQKITSSIYADDEFKVFISTAANTPGVEFAQGAGWSINFRNNLYLYGGFTTYFLHVWVRDIGGGPTGFLGEFSLTSHRACTFANGSQTLLTEANSNWQVSPRLSGTSLTGGPITTVPYFHNTIPNFQTASMPVTDLGQNIAGSGGNNWPSMPVLKPFGGVSSAAHWIGPNRGKGPEMWFTTRITCKTANLGNVDPN